MTSRLSIPVVFGLFFVSGACALVHQVVWSRMLTHILGSTVFAVSTVLAAFMSGLAIGSYCLGRRGDRARNPLRWFAGCEVGIAVAALGVVALLDHLTPAYVWITRSLGDSFTLLTLARFAVVFALLIVPTTLMGATLPVLSRYAIRRFERAGHTLGALYGINTLGAVCGSLAAGFYLIGHLGIHRTVYVAVGLNAAVGVGAWLLSRGAGAERAAQISDTAATAAEPPSPYQLRLHRLLLWAFALSGLASFAYEVLWTRAMIFFVGNSTYAFVTMLSAFLTGIALGSYAIRLVIDRLRRPLRTFAWVQVGIGISAALAMPLLIWLMRSEFVLSLLLDENHYLRSGFATRFGLCFAVMLVPTLLIGTTFPLVGRIVLTDLQRTSGEVGKVYAVNTLGNIVGALLPGFLILHFVGIHKGVWLLAAVNLGIGALFLAHGPERLHPRRLAVLGGGVAALVVALLVVPVGLRFPAQGQTANDKVLYYREGPAATTMVFARPGTGYKSMAVDSIEIGGTSPSVDYKQQWLAHLPKLLLAGYRTELSVGLGSGILAGESARHEQLERITCVEIAPTVVRAARCFSADNHGVLDSPRVAIVVDDAVNYLMATRDRFDIISTDGKTEPEYSVNGTFFSTEYYTLMRDRLAPGGVAIQWIALHYPPRILRSVFRTFTDVFPHVMLWQAHGNCFLVGSNHEVTLDAAAIAGALGDARRPFDGWSKYGITTPQALMAHLIARQDVLKERLADVPANSLERPIIEFYDPGDFRASREQRRLANLELILSIRGTGSVGAWRATLTGEAGAAYDAEGAYLLGQRALLAGEGPAVFGGHFHRALALAPDNQAIRYEVQRHYLRTAQLHAGRGDIASAEVAIAQAIDVWPNDAEARLLYGHILVRTNRATKAVAQFEAAARLNPRHIPTRHLLASLYLGLGRVDDSVAQLRAVLEIDPDDLVALYSLGYLLGEQGAFADALPLVEKAYRLAPDNPRAIHCYAWVTYLSGDKEKARRIVRRGGRYYTVAEEMERCRGIILR